MNFLAHVQLSCGNGELITGSLVADAYKGKKYEVLPIGIRHGVLLHRRIDHFTDTFEDVRAVKKILSPYFGRYAGVALDVYFDHLLSIKWHHFYKDSLENSVKNAHRELENNFEWISAESKAFLLKLIEYNWLNSYRQKRDLEMIFKQMSLRFGLDVLENSILPLETHIAELESAFMRLYPLLISESIAYIDSVGL